MTDLIIDSCLIDHFDIAPDNRGGDNMLTRRANTLRYMHDVEGFVDQRGGESIWITRIQTSLTACTATAKSKAPKSTSQGVAVCLRHRFFHRLEQEVLLNLDTQPIG